MFIHSGYKLHALGYLYGDKQSQNAFKNSKFGKAQGILFEGQLKKKFERCYAKFFIEAKAYVANQFGEESVSLSSMIQNYDDATKLDGTLFGNHVLKVYICF